MFEIYFNIILPSTPRFFQVVSFLQAFRLKYSLLKHVKYMNLGVLNKARVGILFSSAVVWVMLGVGMHTDL
jgi:hypothetical protein